MAMRLHEEYFHRHQLNIPVVLYTSHSTVFLYTSKPSYKWRIFSTVWRPQDRHPGFFEVGYSEVVHNGCVEGEVTRDLIFPTHWNWDQYEVGLLNQVKTFKKDNWQAVPVEQQLLAAWEVFLIMYDSLLSKRMPIEFCRVVEHTIRGDLSLEERHTFLKSADSYLSRDLRLWEAWSSRIKPLSSVKSEWLVNLING